MFWRFAGLSLAGALFGIASFFFYDIFIANWTGFEAACGNPSPSYISEIVSGKVDAEITKEYPSFFEEARTLTYKGILLLWLTQRGDRALESGFRFGILFPVAGVIMGQLRTRKRLEKLLVAASTNI